MAHLVDSIDTRGHDGRILTPFVVAIRVLVAHDVSAVATPPCIILLSILVSNLTTRLAPTVLSALHKARVKIRSNDSFVELRAPNVFHAVESILMGIVLDKAEAAGSLLKPIKPHDEASDLTASNKTS